MPLPAGHGLVQLAQGRAVRIADCDIVNAGGHGIALETIEGEVTGNTLSAADAAIFSLDARGLHHRQQRYAKLAMAASWSGDATPATTAHSSSTIGSRICGTRAGGSGQNGNAINIFRADNVIVRGNRIRNAAFSAVRGNKASNM